MRTADEDDTGRLAPAPVSAVLLAELPLAG
jgi:hypothetical protein